MEDNERQLTAGELIAHLEREGFLSPADSEAIAQHVARRPEELEEQNTPGLTKALLGFGAWFSALFFIGFLQAIGMLGIGPAANMFLGTLYIVAAIMLFQFKNNFPNESSQVFWLQFTFVFMLAGKIVALIGLGDSLDSSGPEDLVIMPIALGLITAITYPFFQVNLERFLSVLSTMGLFFVWIIMNSFNVLIPVYVLVCVAGIGIVFLYRKTTEKYFPIGYALVIALAAALVFETMHFQFGIMPRSFQSGLLQRLPVNITLMVSLVGLYFYIAGDIKQIEKGGLFYAGLLAILIGCFSVPGVLVAVGLLVLGYHFHDNIITSTGLGLLPVFLFLFYYQLDISLLHKSFILMISGVLFLAASFLIDRKGWSKA